MRQTANQAISRWLLIICILIVLMVMLGGITRLTQSGLSMTNWQFTGSLPPLSNEEWLREFDRYRTSPEFRLINDHYELKDFKQIFWWEYIHRALGRIVGLTFLLPLLYFSLRRKMTRGFALRCFAAFVLIVSQGVLGWIMVQSGLDKVPHVNHFLLAAHLCLAISTLIYTVYLRQSLEPGSEGLTMPRSLVLISRITAAVIGIQIILGAFVAGLKAGYIYNTFPKMGEHWLPPELFSESRLIYNGAALQFIHRITGTIVLVLAFCIYILAKRRSLHKSMMNRVHLFMTLVVCQMIAGIICILCSVPVFFGVVHQLVAVLLVVTISGILFNVRVAKPGR